MKNFEVALLNRTRTMEEIENEYRMIQKEYIEVVKRYFVAKPYPHWSEEEFNVSDWTFSKSFNGYNPGRVHDDWMNESVTMYLNFLNAREKNLYIELNRVRMANWGKN